MTGIGWPEAVVYVAALAATVAILWILVWSTKK